VKRILIIGCGGSGKSTLSKKLGKQLNLPVIHLDEYYWNPGWKPTTSEVWSEKVDDLISQEAWIMDGNYGGTMRARIERADANVFLHFPTLVCLYRVLKRTFKYFGKTRPNMPKNCPERFSLEFYHYILIYNLTRVPTIKKLLNEHVDSKEIIILKS